MMFVHLDLTPSLKNWREMQEWFQILSIQYLSETIWAATVNLKVVNRNLIRLPRFELLNAIKKLLSVKSIYEMITK